MGIRPARGAGAALRRTHAISCSPGSTSSRRFLARTAEGQDRREGLDGIDDANRLRRAAAALGPREVVVRGRSTIGVLADGAWTALGIRRDAAVDPIGAGDAFNAGYIAVRLRGGSVDDALKAGARAERRSPRQSAIRRGFPGTRRRDPARVRGSGFRVQGSFGVLGSWCWVHGEPCTLNYEPRTLIVNSEPRTLYRAVSGRPVFPIRPRTTSIGHRSAGAPRRRHDSAARRGRAARQGEAAVGGVDARRVVDEVADPRIGEVVEVLEDPERGVATARCTFAIVPTGPQTLCGAMVR